MGQIAVVIPEKIYFKIGEVCDLVGVQAHVLRYWETEFSMLSPQKNRSGQRSYRRRDVEISLRIKQLLYDEMFTIAGAKKKLQGELRESSKLKVVPTETVEREYQKGVESSPLRFDNDIEIENGQNGELSSHSSLSDEGREALRTLAGHLLELREMLAKRQ